MNTNALIQAVRDHAQEHYEADGWDILVECWDNSDIAEKIEGADTKAEAIAKCAYILDLLDENRREIQSTAF
jgi:hypothetical protein